MWSRPSAMVGLAAVAIALAIAPAAAGKEREKLEMYTLEGGADKIAQASGASSSPACDRRHRDSEPTPS
jgi:hypothetical protein